LAGQAVEAEFFLGAEHVECELVPEVEGFEIGSCGWLDDGALAARQTEDDVAVLADCDAGEGKAAASVALMGWSPFT
jgi:hypothetical protein